MAKTQGQAENIKVVRRHQLARNATGVVDRAQGKGYAEVCGQAREHVRGRRVIDVVRIGHIELGRALGRVCMQNYESAGISTRKRPQENCVHDGKHGRGSADTQGQAQNRNCDAARLFPHPSQRVGKGGSFGSY